MEGFTGLMIGFFFGCCFCEGIEWIKKRIIKNQNKNNTDIIKDE